MSTFKFTRSGGRALFSNFAWPLPTSGAPGAFIEVRGPLQACRHGLHVCRLEDLPYWLHDELWHVETEGSALSAHDGLVVQRARLVRKVETWQTARQAFASACVERALARAAEAPEDADVAAYLNAATHCRDSGNVMVAAYASALAFTRFVSADRATTAYREERSQQAQLLAALLQL
jgi:hypothetical protein